MPLDPAILGPDLTPARHHFYTETATQWIYGKIVRPGDTVMDLGANRAYHTTGLLKAVGETGCVHAFEPNPELLAGLAGLASNVRLWPFAVGDHLGMVDLHVPDGLDGWASLEDIRAELPDRGFKIHTTVQVAIDEIQELRDAVASFVKIDVERREANAVRGMSNFLRRCQPVVVCEGNLEANFVALEELGYQCFDFFGNKAAVDNVLANFLACPPHCRERLVDFLPSRREWETASITAATL